MPVKNAAPWLIDCLDSVLAQQFERWELIAVDDGSTDDSLAILQSYAEQHDRMFVFHNHGNGIIAALNTAMEHAQAPFISRMDADDVMPTDKLQLFYDRLSFGDCDVVTGLVQYFSSSPVSEGYRAYEQWLNERCQNGDHWQWVYRECVIASANWLCRREFVEIKEDVYPEDYELVFQWYRHGLRIGSVNDITHHWREHPSRTSRTSRHYQQRAFYELKTRHFLSMDRDPSRPLVVLGKNQKTKLLRSLLPQQLGVIYLERENISALENIKNPQVLVAVFPTEKERKQLSQWLQGLGLTMGVSWWYC